jgi:predicted  nucleic acid-binding Zn-ribbon protein
MFPGKYPTGLWAPLLAAALTLNPHPVSFCQDAPVLSETGTEQTQHEKETVSALESVAESLRIIEGDLGKLREQLKTVDEVESESLQKEILALTEKKNALQTDFEAIATGIDPEEYMGDLSGKFVIGDEIDEVLKPIIEELKKLTEKPREIEQLRTELDQWKTRLTTTDNALENIEKIPTESISKDLQESIRSTREIWAERREQAENRVQAVTYQLEQAEKTQPSFITTAKEGLRSFYRSRGRNFLLCIGAFFATFFLLRYLHQQLDRFFPWKKREKRPFYLRLIDVGLNLFSVAGAITAAILTLYATGDWVLMGLAIIVLVGVSLAAKNALPKFYDQGRLLLNLGEIREGERVIYGGIPWKVERLSFYSTLRNEALRGGTVRLPVSQLSGMISRPQSEEGEFWFPCHEGDWIELPDEGKGRVIAQTPEYVQLVKLGGAKITIPTVDFLSKSPTNLSQGFRISTTFGIDYKHQADCTDSIPEKMWAYITRELCSLIDDREKLLSLKVEFASAGASSLDYSIIADFDGSLAAKIQVIERALQRFAVEACNENGWEIPFTQVTLHNAFPTDEDPDKAVTKPAAPKLP